MWSWAGKPGPILQVVAKGHKAGASLRERSGLSTWVCSPGGTAKAFSCDSGVAQDPGGSRRACDLIRLELQQQSQDSDS